MEELLPGLHGAPNVHPVFLHFPLVLLPVALGFALVAAITRRDDFSRFSRWLLYLGFASAVPAAWTGWEAMLGLEGAPGHDLIHVHMAWMFTATGLVALSAVFAFVLARRPTTTGGRWAVVVALAVTTTVLTMGADRGALLVFRYGIGTHQEPPPPGHEDGGHGQVDPAASHAHK